MLRLTCFRLHCETAVLVTCISLEHVSLEQAALDSADTVVFKRRHRELRPAWEMRPGWMAAESLIQKRGRQGGKQPKARMVYFVLGT